jgi:hypothetical protein
VKSPIDRLVDEAKSSLVPSERGGSEARWKAVEDRVVARMAEDRAELVAEVNASPRRAKVLQVGAFVLAAAAAVAVVVRNEPGGPLVDGAVSSQADLTAGSLRGTEGAGEVRVDGQPASAGHELRGGEVLEVDGARALLERPRKVTWLLERGVTGAPDAPPAGVARARVKSAGESLVLGLEDGAIEAQVTPVPSGEAFAVDVVAGKSVVRVAVHGTHLRVARTGTRVVVDLSEGVVSIGAPPRSGSTYGTLVTAPSHIEFDAANLAGTLTVDHSPAAVRAPLSLVSHEATVAVRDVPAAGPYLGAGALAAPAAPAAPAVLATVPRPASLPPPRAVDPAKPEPAAKADPSPPALSAREARESIAAAVRDCAAARRRPDNVRVTVTSALRLKVARGGEVETAQFDPPLLPEIQACAATAIYKAKLEPGGGSVTIPIDFAY